MENEEEGLKTLEELIARKRKLTELRNNILLKQYNNILLDKTDDDEIHGSPSNKHPRSVSPPTPLYSPLTPIMLKNKLKTNQDRVLATPSTSNVSVISNNFSPLPKMSPETEEIYNELLANPIENEKEDTLENSDESVNEIYQYDSDDSVRDPDFNIQQKEPRTVEESDTDSESLSDESNIEKENEIMISSTNEDLENSNKENDSNEENKNMSKKKRSRKEKEISKVLRNAGKSYMTEKGKTIPDRKRQDLKPCRLKCAELFTSEEQQCYFEYYWNLGDRDKRANFISKSVTIMPKKSQITGCRRMEREFYCKYSLEMNNVRKPTCKECFCRILGETKGFINVILKKKKVSPIGVIPEDQRGRSAPKHKKTDDELAEVRTHILSFPCYESHYCRKTTDKKYLPADLSIAKMYREYKKTTRNPVSIKLYAKCFHDLNLSFKKPSKDTCNTCDVLNAKIKVASGNDEMRLMFELTEHQQQAEDAYAEKRADKVRAKSDPSFRAFAFDLQQCLPTPYLKTSISFYKRQLWTFNLTVHNLATDEATCYMWDETRGARGANQIASCLWNFCKNLPPEVKEVTFYSDTCGGQNKNNVVAMMFMFLLKNHPTLEKINHKFLLSGHTHMECDSDHAIIEKTKKKTQMKINHLYDWVQLIRTCKVQKQFQVEVMTLNDFMDFSELKGKNGLFTLKKLNDSGNRFLWQPIKWLQYTKNNFGVIQFKHSLKQEHPFESINLKKKGRPNSANPFKLNQISKKPLPISDEKKKDIMDVLELIDETFRDFYRKIKTISDSSASYDPDLDEDDPDFEE